MHHWKIVTAVWLLCTIVVFVIPGPEIEVGRTVDGDSTGVSVLPLTFIIGLASLGIGSMAIGLLALGRSRR